MLNPSTTDSYTTTKITVVGGGVAGCAAALAAARGGAEVTLLTRLADPGESNTRYAQGGIIYTGPEDSPELLTEDILAAGAGERSAAWRLATEGPRLVQRLLIEELQIPFERDSDGLHLTREGAHSVERIIHHQDATGSAIQRAMTAAVLREPNITVLTGAEALRLSVRGGECVGVVVHRNSEVRTLPGEVILATGGLGALYQRTTNPPAATGDGLALALEAGTEVRDLHYVQFHPTALYAPGERFLISESLRGEGGILLDPDGEEFVRHPLGSLAPRDIVAREIWAMMQRTDSPCAYLDITSRAEGWLEYRFPNIHARCREAGMDLSREPIPVVPAAHYSCGGIITDHHGRTSLPGLRAAGEVASTGLHGANRLASTSLLEGLVWGWHSGRDAAQNRYQTPANGSRSDTEHSRPLQPTQHADHLADHLAEQLDEQLWDRLRETLWERAGLMRSGEELALGLKEINYIAQELPREESLSSLRLRRALRVARAVLTAAHDDNRNRGCHYREDATAASMNPDDTDGGFELDRGRIRIGRP